MRNFLLWNFWRCSFTSPFHKYQKHAAAQLEEILSLQTILISCSKWKNYSWIGRVSSDQLWNSELNGMDISLKLFIAVLKNSMKHTLRWMSINVFKINPNARLHWYKQENKTEIPILSSFFPRWDIALNFKCNVIGLISSRKYYVPCQRLNSSYLMRWWKIHSFWVIRVTTYKGH